LYSLNFVFSKKGAMIYISHVDLMRLFMRALRRADIPVKVTQGFNPHPKLSIKRALKLGLESENEEATIVITQPLPLQEFISSFQRNLPDGIQVISANLLPS